MCMYKNAADPPPLQCWKAFKHTEQSTCHVFLGSKVNQVEWTIGMNEGEKRQRERERDPFSVKRSTQEKQIQEPPLYKQRRSWEREEEKKTSRKKQKKKKRKKMDDRAPSTEWAWVGLEEWKRWMTVCKWAGHQKKSGIYLFFPGRLGQMIRPISSKVCALCDNCNALAAKKKRFYGKGFSSTQTSDDFVRFYTPVKEYSVEPCFCSSCAVYQVRSCFWKMLFPDRVGWPSCSSEKKFFVGCRSTRGESWSGNTKSAQLRLMSQTIRSLKINDCRKYDSWYRDLFKTSLSPKMPRPSQCGINERATERPVNGSARSMCKQLGLQNTLQMPARLSFIPKNWISVSKIMFEI